MQFRQIFVTALFSSFLTAFFVISFSGLLKQNLINEKSEVNSLKSEDIKSKIANTEEEVLVNMVEKANSAVVAVVVKKDMPIYEQYYERRQVDPWGWFGDISLPKTRETGTKEMEIGGGSGFVVTENGFIVTNRHVVDDKEARYSVVFSNDETYDAEVLVRDEVLDIAVLKILGLEPDKKLSFLEFGDSEKLKLGQKVIAIGNALAEFRNSVSVGVVSGLSRTIVASDGQGMQENLEQVIQTDAAINPGNSGGPLLNLQGEVIGVNVATSKTADNIGFALPVNAVKGIVESVQKYGKIVRPFIGVRYTMLTPEIIKNNNLNVAYGALVVGGEKAGEVAVLPDSPADKAGIKANDIIVAIDGEELKNKSLATILREKTIGEEITALIIRDGEKLEKKLVPKEAPQN